TDKAGTKDPVVVTGAEPGSTVTLKDKDGNPIGSGTADDNGRVEITPTKDIPAGDVTATSTDKAGNESNPSEAKKATTPVTVTKQEDKDKYEPTVTPITKPEGELTTEDVTGAVTDNGEGTVTVKPGTELPTTPGEHKVPVVVTYPDKSTDELEVPVTITGKTDTKVNVPADKTPVKDTEHLTEEEKATVKEKVEKANPGTTVTVDDKGNATVTDPVTKVTTPIPSKELIEPISNGNTTDTKVNVPADKTPVKDTEHLTEEEKATVKEKVEKANPGTTVTVDDKGNATVTDPVTKVTTPIPSKELIEPISNGNTTDTKVNVPADKTPVKDTEHLTEEEKTTVKEKVEKANPGATVTVDDKGNATVTDPVTKVTTSISSKELIERIGSITDKGESSSIKGSHSSNKGTNMHDSGVAMNTNNHSKKSTSSEESSDTKQLPHTGDSSGNLETLVGSVAFGLAVLGMVGKKKKEE
ncbi:LPXTG cell wall anchor domain-containing protein, partial [Carnobacteriaceae bacterium zg-ZUI78]|nr:LPXTG cell wall anchor domain-containing protein [Carnobacteriaceae bacterium zg-ZUI78]